MPHLIDVLERTVSRLPVKMIQIKDDTFTTNKKKVVEICRAIRQRRITFLWSYDTKTDLLTEEVVREMRLAGCERLSLGVESGSPKILKSIDKKITTDEILRSTELAKRYGIRVRYYMMLGNRGETAETFRETLRFMERAKPHQYLFSCLSIYPGTRDFQEAEQAGWLDRDIYFSEDFQELKTPFDASEADTALMSEWFQKNKGLKIVYRESVTEYESILARLGDHHAAHLDLGSAYYESGRLDDAERHVRRALELGHPAPGLAYNYLACIAKARGDLSAMMEAWSEAARIDPQHYVLVRNIQAAKTWFRAGGPDRGLALHIEVGHDFQLLERTSQPTLPGPLPPDLAKWDDAPGS
jgi:anaerobic magnesium-protoporphyrin IX monomethyl ester cyclase